MVYVSMVCVSTDYRVLFLFRSVMTQTEDMRLLFSIVYRFFNAFRMTESGYLAADFSATVEMTTCYNSALSKCT